MIVDGYVRVSQVGGRSGPSFISPVLQREQIEAWASTNQVLIGEIFEELDESGARKDRPLLARAIQRVEAGHSEGIVVAKLDRFGRSLVDSLAAIERLRKAGGTFVSVQDGLDLGTDTGKLVLRIMLSMAEWELDRIRTMWDTAKARAIARGVHVGRTPPFGYQRDASGHLVADPSNALIVGELFSQRAKGMPMRALCRWLEGRGVLTGHGNLGWTTQSVQAILRNRTYLGELHSGVHVATGTHKPLIDPVTWQAAQSPRELPSRRRNKPATLLAGLLRCAGCQMVLFSNSEKRSGGRRMTSYQCHGRSAAGKCPSPAHISGALIEPLMEETFFSQLRSETRRAKLSTRGLRRLEDEVEEAETNLRLYRDTRSIGAALGPDAFASGLIERRKTVERALTAVARERRRIVRPKFDYVETEEGWPEMTVNERREAISELIDCAFVLRGRGRVRKRTYIYLRGEGPVNLPRPGTRRRELRSFDPTELGSSAEVRPPKPWSKARIRSQLERFLGDRRTWPLPEEFYRAGFGPLFAQVVRTGGPGYWTTKLAVQPLKGSRALRAWDDETIRASLGGFLARKSDWPTAKQFRAAGFGALYGSLGNHGGIDRWASEFGLVPPGSGDNRPRPGS